MMIAKSKGLKGLQADTSIQDDNITTVVVIGDSRIELSVLHEMYRRIEAAITNQDEIAKNLGGDQ